MVEISFIEVILQNDWVNLGVGDLLVATCQTMYHTPACVPSVLQFCWYDTLVNSWQVHKMF